MRCKVIFEASDSRQKHLWYAHCDNLLSSRTRPEWFLICAFYILFLVLVAFGLYELPNVPILEFILHNHAFFSASLCMHKYNCGVKTKERQKMREWMCGVWERCRVRNAECRVTSESVQCQMHNEKEKQDWALIKSEHKKWACVAAVSLFTAACVCLCRAETSRRYKLIRSSGAILLQLQYECVVHSVTP